MACNGANQPLLSGLSVEDPKPQITNNNNKGSPRRRRRFRPLTDVAALDGIINDKDSTPCCESSIFGKPSRHPISFMKVAVFLAIYLGVGTICFNAVKDQIKGEKTNNGILDSVYFCIVTMTTVGYGDLVPNSVLSKLLACAFVFSGMALVGLSLNKAAEYLVEKQEILVLVKALHLYDDSKVDDPTETLKELETNKAKYKCIMMSMVLSVLIVGGTVFLVTVEKMDVVDAFYCVCSTVTTLGYGDKSFSTKGGRVFAPFWIPAGTVSLALLLLYVAKLNTETRQKAFAKWVLTRRMTRVDWEAADIDEDGVVSAAEFIVYKLKEMGKISEEDVVLVMEEFEDLDVDHSGTLSLSEIISCPVILRLTLPS